LFEELRELRRQIAERERLPAYVIFHDATLGEMAATRPTSPEELLLVSGVGERKLGKYGEEFLAVLRRRGEMDPGEEAAAVTQAD
ncbi:MAG: HRDC domain-containing protein, partial [bacterium]